jgi:hypothetical protein
MRILPLVLLLSLGCTNIHLTPNDVKIQTLGETTVKTCTFTKEKAECTTVKGKGFSGWGVIGTLIPPFIKGWF